MIQSYALNTSPQFPESAIAPVYLGELDERVYYAFAPELSAPAGGNEVSEEELQQLAGNSPVFMQIKREAAAPLWKQTNALADVSRLQGRSDLNADEQKTLSKAEAVLAEVARLRGVSGDLETALLEGKVIDLSSDATWGEVEQIEAVE